MSDAVTLKFKSRTIYESPWTYIKKIAFIYLWRNSISVWQGYKRLFGIKIKRTLREEKEKV